MPKIITDLTARLKEEARRQIAEVGYKSLNIRSIAKKCGIGIGTFYHYFPSKDALIASFLLEDWMKLIEGFKSTAAAGNARLLIETVFSGLSGFIDENSELFSSASETVESVPRKYHVILRNQIAEILLPLIPEPFTTEFIAEALLTWSTEKRSFDELSPILDKII